MTPEQRAYEPLMAILKHMGYGPEEAHEITRSDVFKPALGAVIREAMIDQCLMDARHIEDAAQDAEEWEEPNHAEGEIAARALRRLAKELRAKALRIREEGKK